MGKMCRKSGPEANSILLCILGEYVEIQSMYSTNLWKLDILKKDYWKSSKNLTSFLFLNLVSFYEDYEKQKGHGANYHLFSDYQICSEVSFC